MTIINLLGAKKFYKWGRVYSLLPAHYDDLTARLQIYGI